MSLYVLDTDHLTLLRKGYAKVVARIAAGARMGGSPDQILREDRILV